MENNCSQSSDRIKFRTQVLAGHLIPNNNNDNNNLPLLRSSECLSYSPPDLAERINFDTKSMRKLMDGKYMEDIDWLFGLITQSELFCRRDRGGKLFVSPDFNSTMEEQREMTMRRIAYFKENGLFDGWFTENQGPDKELRNFAFTEVTSLYDHSLSVKMGVHLYLW